MTMLMLSSNSLLLWLLEVHVSPVIGEVQPVGLAHRVLRLMNAPCESVIWTIDLLMLVVGGTALTAAYGSKDVCSKLFLHCIRPSAISGREVEYSGCRKRQTCPVNTVLIIIHAWALMDLTLDVLLLVDGDGGDLVVMAA